MDGPTRGTAYRDRDELWSAFANLPRTKAARAWLGVADG